MKMALQYAQSTDCPGRSRFIALRGAYHGDTIGAMSLCDPVTGMHSLFSGVLPKQIFVERPSCRFDAPYDPASFRPMEEQAYKSTYITKEFAVFLSGNIFIIFENKI